MADWPLTIKDKAVKDRSTADHVGISLSDHNTNMTIKMMR